MAFEADASEFLEYQVVVAFMLSIRNTENKSELIIVTIYLTYAKRKMQAYFVSNSMRLTSTGTVWSELFLLEVAVVVVVVVAAAAELSAAGVVLAEASPPGDSTTGSGFGWVNVNGNSTDKSLEKIKFL